MSSSTTIDILKIKPVSKLFEPITIRGTTFKNRIGVSPMGMCSTRGDGIPHEFHLAHYGSFAIGGAGLVVCEGTAVEPRGRVTTGCPGLWTDQQIEPWSKIVTVLRGQGCVAGIQLAHAGRKAGTYVGNSRSLSDSDGGWDTIAPSALRFSDVMKIPKEATVDDIDIIVNSLVTAAQRAISAGFQLIELHYAHGYFVNSFLSAATNRRQDRYGGSLANRMRLGLEIADKVRRAIPADTVLAVRISFTDYVVDDNNGWDIQQSVELAKQLKALGVDLIDVSSGGVVSGIGYEFLNTSKQQHSAAAVIQLEAGIPTAAVGKIRDPLMAEKLLRDNCSTFVFIGRAFLNDPHWPYRASDQLKDRSFNYPKPYDWCIGWTAYMKWRRDLDSNQ
ncbi:NADPH dehydrogenase-like [Oppia nitens]|uniref:NADPH dehydrogenase-like n=1 Tax=Oppia nitens TaxID=1686743 RepID=UPI0023DA462D|nr:NADPH dehydrogenase-like [Oppia nitens]